MAAGLLRGTGIVRCTVDLSSWSTVISASSTLCCAAHCVRRVLSCSDEEVGEHAEYEYANRCYDYCLDAQRCRAFHGLTVVVWVEVSAASESFAFTCEVGEACFAVEACVSACSALSTALFCFLEVAACLYDEGCDDAEDDDADAGDDDHRYADSTISTHTSPIIIHLLYIFVYSCGYPVQRMRVMCIPPYSVKIGWVSARRSDSLIGGQDR